MTPLELDSAQRWAHGLEPGTEIRTTSGPNGKVWEVIAWDGYRTLMITRSPGRRVQVKDLSGDALVAAYRATRQLANQPAAKPARPRYP